MGTNTTDTTDTTAAAPTKTTAKPAVKRPTATKAPAKAKPVVATKKAPAVIATQVAVALTDKPSKPKKPKMVRDSFTIPKSEFTVLQDLKERSNKLARPAKKTELLRAGIKALAALSDAEFLKAIEAVPSLKTGRPSKSSAE